MAVESSLFPVYLVLLVSLSLSISDVDAAVKRQNLTLILHTHPTANTRYDMGLSILNNSESRASRKRHYVESPFFYAIEVARGTAEKPHTGVIRKDGPDLGLSRHFVIRGEDVKTSAAAELKSLNTTIHLLMRKSTNLVIGTHTACPTEAMTASALNKPLISFKCDAEAVSDKKLYPTFARTQPPAWKIAKFIFSILRAFSWNKYTLVVRESSALQHTARTLKRLSAEDPDVKYEVLHEKGFRKSTMSGFSRIIEDTYKTTRIYVFLGKDVDLVLFSYLLHLKKLSTTGLYAVITVATWTFMENYSGETKRHFIGGIMPGKHPNITDRIFQSILVICPRTTGSRDMDKIVPLQEMTNHVEKIRNNSNTIKKKSTKKKSRWGTPLPVTTVHVYDAVMVYFKAVAKAIEGASPDEIQSRISNGTKIFEYIQNSTFQSILGYDIYIDQNGDAEGNYSLVSLIENNSGKFILGKVAEFSATYNNTIPKLKKRLDNKILWANGKPPLAEPKCKFDNSNCGIKQIAWIAIGSSVCLALVIILLCILMLRRVVSAHRLRIKSRPKW